MKFPTCVFNGEGREVGQIAEGLGRTTPASPPGSAARSLCERTEEPGHDGD